MGEAPVKVDSVLELLLSANQLKRVPRTGWVMRGVTDAESVADHAFGVAFIALVLAELTKQLVDSSKLLAIALLHDLPEAVLSDIPAPALRYLSSAAKADAEQEVLSALLTGIPWRNEWKIWWREYEDQSSLEATLVRDADQLDMLVQAYVYERTAGNHWLDEFWMESTRASFGCEASRNLFDALREIRNKGTVEE